MSIEREEAKEHLIKIIRKFVGWFIFSAVFAGIYFYIKYGLQAHLS